MSPSAPLRPCIQQPCPALVKHGRCFEHQRQHEQQRRPAWVTTFYNSTAWKKTRAMKKAESPLCRQCLEANVITPTEDVDHIIPLMVRPDLGLVMENLDATCREHHAIKTARGR